MYSITNGETDTYGVQCDAGTSVRADNESFLRCL
jgi:hypothetical protein